MSAAAARKLQKEIDVVLKKVDDGLDEFDNCYEQATGARDSQQRERLGEDLKKSINKLQRLRTQIREWISQSGVSSSSKDKLEEVRKRIESDMTRFKDFERELKTKAFSSCALKRGDELELEEAEKLKYQEWLSQTIQDLNTQLEQYEADIELLDSKKSLNGDDKARLAQLRIFQEHHQWHIGKLELLLRGVDNEAVDLGDLAVVRDSVEFYVESCEEPDYYHDEGLYESFDLTAYEDRGGGAPGTPKTGSSEKDAVDTPKDAGTPASSKEEPQRKSKDREKKKKEDKKARAKEGSNTPKGAGKAAGQVIAQPAFDSVDTKQEVRANIEPDEVKVQEDQLLSEADEFVCKICQVHVVGCSPKLTSCSHLFCGDCIAQWFNQHPESQTWAQRAKATGPERVVPCPVCKQPLNEKRDLYPVCCVTSRSENLLLWRMLSSLKIMCANHSKVRSDGQCEWIGEYGSYQEHIRACENARGTSGPMADHAPSATSDSEAPPRLPDSDGKALHKGHEAAPDTSQAPTASPVRERSPGPSSQPRSPATQPRSLAAASKPVLVQSPGPSSAGSTSAPSRTRSQAASPAPSAASSNSVALASTPVAPRQASPERPRILEDSSAEAPGEGAGARAVAAAATTVDPQRDCQDSVGPPSLTATSSFEPTNPTMVRIQVGDRVQVLEQHASGWTYCKNLNLPEGSNSGWAPSWAVQPAQEPAVPAAVKPKARDEAKAKAPQVQPAVKEARPAPQARVAAVTPPQQAPVRSVLRASAAFTATSPSQLDVAAQDLVEIIEQHASGWTYGRKAAASGAFGVEGWFPNWVVAVQR